MGELINSASRLEYSQKATIRQGVLDKRNWRKVHEDVCALRPVTQKLVRELMEQYSTDLAVKSTAKAEGSALIRKFLADAKQGVCVEEMAALIEQALYKDLLRRYSEMSDPLVSMEMYQVLKLELSHRTARLAKEKYEDEKAQKELEKSKEDEKNEKDGIEQLRGRIEDVRRRSGGNSEKAGGDRPADGLVG